MARRYITESWKCRNWWRTNRHRARPERLASVYRSMIDRCHSPSHIEYERYGGRGIEVCTLWRSSRIAFYEWALENGYRDDLQLDRKKNHRGYSPSNCRFVTPKVNSNNRRDNVLIEFRGKKRTASQWAEETGINAKIIRHRIRKGWNPQRALTRPVGVKISFTMQGETLTLAEWSLRTGIGYHKLYERLVLYGHKPEDVVYEGDGRLRPKCQRRT
jgi:hypothetical protein